MKNSGIDRTGKVIAIIGGVAMLLFSYMIICFFRLDWIRYDVVDRSWQLESMQCEQQAPMRVIRLYIKTGSQADIPIRYSREMFEHLTQQSDEYLPVKRKLVGYLREWDYGIVIPVNIAGKFVAKRTVILEQQHINCSFKSTNNVNKNSADTRRKMR